MSGLISLDTWKGKYRIGGGRGESERERERERDRNYKYKERKNEERETKKEIVREGERENDKVIACSALCFQM